MKPKMPNRLIWSKSQILSHKSISPRDLYKMTLILTNERKTKLENIKRNTEQLYCPSLVSS